jgi:hypothetical protein
MSRKDGKTSGDARLSTFQSQEEFELEKKGIFSGQFHPPGARPEHLISREVKAIVASDDPRAPVLERLRQYGSADV